MWLSDTSVKRPVFATVISLLLVAFGTLAYQNLSTREYPDITPARVSVSADYPGASAAVVETKVTQILEDAVSGIEGVKTIRSTSRDGRGSVNIEFELNRDLDLAANDVRDRISRVTGRLPDEIRDLRVAKAESDARPIAYYSVTTDEMSSVEIADYVDRYILDQLAAVPGVSEVGMNGGGRPAIRLSIDRQALAAQNLTVTDITDALRTENVELPAGTIESNQRQFPVRITRNYETPEDFRNLVLRRGQDGHLVRLGDVADISIGPTSTQRLSLSNGIFNSTTIRVSKQSTANTVTVLEELNATVDRIQASLPDHMGIYSGGDPSQYIRAALNNVYVTIGATVFLVGLVIYLFLCTFRATFVPMVTVPVCLISSFIALAAFGFSINLITLLALVLAIGLVVDDAIVVLENISRRISLGEPPLLAAYRGTKQVAFAVITTTLVLVAVFVPIAFLTDNVGRIFSELAVTIAAAVIFSSVLALSLAPMMCSKILREKPRDSAFARMMNRNFDRLSNGYERTVTFILQQKWLAPGILLSALGLGYFLVQNIEQEYAPSQDQGSMMLRIQVAEGSSLESMESVINEVHEPLNKYIEDGLIQRTIMFAPGFGGQTNSAIGFINLVPAGERSISTNELIQELMPQWGQLVEAQVFAFAPNGLSRGGGGQPVEFVLQGSNYEELSLWRDQLMNASMDSGLFTRMDSDLDETQQQVQITVDKNRAAELGVSVTSIGTTLQALLSERNVSTYVRDGEEYDVVMQARDDQRDTTEDLQNLYVRSNRSGELIPLSNLVTVQNIAGIAELNRYNRLRAVTISGSLTPDVALGEALAFMEDYVDQNLPDHAQYDYRGESLEYKEASGSMFFTFGVAMLILFLVMAAQFESFVHPFIIMFTVPLGIVGALLGLYVTGNTLNIFSQIGILMIIGIAAKNGILIVEFINQTRDKGVEFTQAIIEGAKIRLRPVLMTTLSTVMGSVPLMLAFGPGSESLNVLGIVVFFGVFFSALLTLFIIPAFYGVMAKNTQSPETIKKELEALEQQIA